MWKPEEIRAAETWQRGVILEDREKVIMSAHAMAEAILKHRSDYGPDCEPLPVDEAACCEMGAEYERDDIFLVWEDDMGWLLSLNTIDGAWAVYGANLPENAWPTTRPQLRSLLQALGAIGGGT